jgi:hypothetical protein
MKLPPLLIISILIISLSTNAEITTDGSLGHWSRSMGSFKFQVLQVISLVQNQLAMGAVLAMVRLYSCCKSAIIIFFDTGN